MSARGSISTIVSLIGTSRQVRTANPSSAAISVMSSCSACTSCRKANPTAERPTGGRSEPISARNTRSGMWVSTPLACEHPWWRFSRAARAVSRTSRPGVPRRVATKATPSWPEWTAGVWAEPRWFVCRTLLIRGVLPSRRSSVGTSLALIITVSTLPGVFDSSARLLPNRILTLGFRFRLLGFSAGEPCAVFPGALAAKDEDHRDRDGEHQQRDPYVEAQAEDVFGRIDAEHFDPRTPGGVEGDV